METSSASYSLPQTLEPDLARLQTYWKDLIRGENSMPFSDDVDLTRLPELASRAVLVTAFEDPPRFRFEHAGKHIADWCGTPLNGAFSDEVQEQGPLEEFTKQCRATVDRRAPTYRRSAASTADAGYSRLLLPTWGEGHVMLLLGAIVELSGQAS